MWLIDVRSFKLKFFQDAKEISQKYAILSHRWEDDEVSHSDMTSRWDRLRLKLMKGWYKIQKCCEQAAKDGLPYAWVDTCCIDKTSSAELQEAINSMFRWYSEAKVCYVFLSDVQVPAGVAAENPLKEAPVAALFEKSRWFTRGWTLQELLAPKKVVFYDHAWRAMGLRNDHKKVISDITGIRIEYLEGFEPSWTVHSQVCIAEVMSWASGRITTRVEDKAYSLLGIFGVSLPMLYGEGQRAFLRLQEELLRSRDDQTIFAWTSAEDQHPMVGSLTDTPDDFIRPPAAYRWLPPYENIRHPPHAISNEGISVELQMLPIRPGVYHAFLNTCLFNVEKQHLVTSEDFDETADDGTLILMAIAFPVREFGSEGHCIRMLPSQEDGLIFCASSRRALSKSRRVTLLNVLKRQEVEAASEIDLAAFEIPKTVSDLWKFSNVHDIVEPPETWPWSPAESQVVKFEQAPAIAGLLTWNGWPHKLYWGYNELPISAIAFGYDFDFNPTCIIVAGRISYDQKGTQILQEVMQKDFVEDHNEVKITEQQRVTVEGGKCELTYYGKDIQSAILHRNDYRDPPILIAVKTIPSTRRSSKGFCATIHLNNSQYDHYYKGKITVRVDRASKKDPWRILITAERGETRVITKSIMPRFSRFVQPRPAYRLGTWDEHQSGASSIRSSSAGLESGRDSSSMTDSDADISQRW